MAIVVYRDHMPVSRGYIKVHINTCQDNLAANRNKPSYSWRG